MITPRQCTAARGLLGMKMEELAQAAGVALTSISAFENAKRPPTVALVQAITDALQRAGIEFTATGVQLIAPIYTYEGMNWYLDLLADMDASGARDICIENVDDTKSSNDVRARMKHLAGAGIQFRFTTRAGADRLDFPKESYRFLPIEHFKNWIVATYADRVAFSIAGETACRVIRDQDLANAMRARFDLLWETLS
jgi:transcriptional regulator with XRE-family HTH domain